LERQTESPKHPREIKFFYWNKYSIAH
jgi:hypothetical protein